MQTINKITQQINKKTKINQEQIKKVLNAFLEVVKQQLNQGESINFKSYFTFKRATTKPQGDKNCPEHQQALDKYKQANKGKGIAAFAKSTTFRNLVNKSRECSKCKVKKQTLVKSAKPTKRISLSVSEGFWSKKK